MAETWEYILIGVCTVLMCLFYFILWKKSAKKRDAAHLKQAKKETIRMHSLSPEDMDELTTQAELGDDEDNAPPNVGTTKVPAAAVAGLAGSPTTTKEVYPLGRYQVIHDTRARESVEMTSLEEKIVHIDTIANIVKTAVCGTRIRGKLESGGWITLKDIERNKVFVVPFANSELEKRKRGKALRKKPSPEPQRQEIEIREAGHHLTVTGTEKKSYLGASSSPGPGNETDPHEDAFMDSRRSSSRPKSKSADREEKRRTQHHLLADMSGTIQTSDLPDIPSPKIRSSRRRARARKRAPMEDPYRRQHYHHHGHAGHNHKTDYHHSHPVHEHIQHPEELEEEIYKELRKRRRAKQPHKDCSRSSSEDTLDALFLRGGLLEEILNYIDDESKSREKRKPDSRKPETRKRVNSGQRAEKRRVTGHQRKPPRAERRDHYHRHRNHLEYYEPVKYNFYNYTPAAGGVHYPAYDGKLANFDFNKGQWKPERGGHHHTHYRSSKRRRPRDDYGGEFVLE